MACPPDPYLEAMMRGEYPRKNGDTKPPKDRFESAIDKEINAHYRYTK